MSFADPYLLVGLLILPVVLLLKWRIGDGAVPGGFSNIALLSGFLFATNISKVVQLQSGYQHALKDLDSLSRE